jgi:hypothetical protein
VVEREVEVFESPMLGTGLLRSVRVGGSLPRRCLQEVDKSRCRCEYCEKNGCDEELSLPAQSEI